MDRVFESGASGSAPAAPGSPSTGYATGGNPSGGVPATKPGPWWFHMVTEELRKVITDAGLTPDHLNVAQLSQAISLLAQAVPSGAVAAFARNTAPAGWLKANGAAVSRSTYAALFAAIGTTFGAGDGSTTFNVPDLRGEFVRGWDDGKGTDSGRTFGSAQGQMLENHTHLQNAANVNQTVNGGSAVAVRGEATSQTGNVTGATAGTETRPRNVALLLCIKT